MSKFLSGRLRQLLVGITGYTENKTVLQTTGKVGIGTTDAQQHSLFVVGSTNITGDTIVGGGLTAVGIGSFQDDVYIDQQLYVGGVQVSGGGGNSFNGITTFTDTTDNTLGDPDTGAVQIDGGLGVNKNVTVGAGLSVIGGLEVAGVSTFNDEVRISNTDSNLRLGLKSNQFSNQLELRHSDAGGSSHIYHTGSGTFHFSMEQGIGDKIQFDTVSEVLCRMYRDGPVELYYDNSKKFETTGYGVSVYDTLQAPQLNITGVSTFAGAADFNGGLTANQATVEDLTNDRVVLAGVGGRLEDSANLTFDGNTLNVVGHTELDNLNVSGIATINSLDVQTDFDVYDTTATFHHDLYVAGNLSIGGTTTVLQAQDLRIFDKDIILGVTTDSNGNDISTDITANHGGVAIASTEGNPLVPFLLTGVNDLPDTYKQIMWTKSNSYGFGTTDAWLFNYAVGIGSTLVPNGTRFAVSEIQFTDDTVNSPNIDIAEHSQLNTLNVSGISTFLNDVHIGSSGATAFFDVSTGNVGINATSPLATLSVGNKSLSDANVPIQISTQSATSQIYYGANNNGGYGLLFGYDNNTFDGVVIRSVGASDKIDFAVNNTTRALTIAANGNIGVNKTSPTSTLDVNGTLNVSGVATFQSNVDLGDDDRLRLGDSQDLEIWHNSSNGNSIIRETGSGNLGIWGDQVRINNSGGGETKAAFITNGAVELYYDNSLKFETTGYGVTVYDTLEVPQLNVTGIASVGTAITMYGATGIVSAISFYGDGANLTNTGATLNAVSGTERLVTTQLTSGTMVDAATDADLTFRASDNLLSTPNIAVSNGISTDGVDYGQPFQLLRADGSGGWSWASVPGIFSVNNILNGFNVQEEGVIVGTAGSIHTLDFRGINVTASADPQPNGIATITFSPTPTFDSVTINGDLDVDGRTELDITNISETLNVVGIATFASSVDINGDLDVDGHTELDQLNVSGVSTFVGSITASTAYFSGNVTIGGTLSYEDVSNIDAVGIITARDGLIVAGVSTFNGLVDINAGGQANTFKVEDLTENRIVIVGPGGELEDDANLTFDGSQLNVGTAITMYPATGIISATAFYGDGSNLTNTGATLSPASGIQRLVVTNLTSGTMVDAATDGDLTFDASNNSLAVPNINISVGATFGGTISAGGTTGTDGQYLKSTGIGVTWADFPTLRTTQTNVATDNQTIFAFAYNVNFLDVFVNGVKLTPSEYTATNGTQIILDSPAFAGDIIEFHSYNITSTYGGGGGGGGGGATLLDQLGDVTIGALAEDQLLQYNSVNGQWENISAATIVGAASSFATKVSTATTATGGQTTFNGTYTVGFVDVYLNGAKLSEDQYTATTGTNIVLGTGASLDDIVEVVGLTANIAGGSYGDSDVDSHLNTSTASSGEVLSWNGSDYDWVSQSVGAGGTWATDDVGINTTKSIGIGTTAKDGYKLYVEGDARVTGILTVGPASVTIDGINNEVTVGTGITLYGNTGIISATSLNVTGALSGDGSSLTGLTGASANTYGNGTAVPQITVDANGRITGISNVLISGGGGGGSSLIINDSGSLVGTAGTIDFGTGLSVSPVSVGIVTVGINTANINADTLNVTGVSTFGSAYFGGGTGFSIGTNTTQSLVQSIGLNEFIIRSMNTGAVNGELKLWSDTITLFKDGGSETMLKATADGPVELYYDNSKKFETTGYGVTVAGSAYVTGIASVTNHLSIEYGNKKLQIGRSLSSSSDSGNAQINLDNQTNGDLQFAASGISNGSRGNFIFYRKESFGNKSAIATLYSDTGNLYVSGNITAPYGFIGDGSKLTGIGVTVVGTWTLESGDGTDYTISGPGLDGSQLDPTIYVRRGQVYQFVNSTGGHPFQIQYEGGNTSGTAYNDGIINNNASSGTKLHWNVQNDAPDVLYYQCTAHTNMWGKIIVLGDVVTEGTWTASAGTPQTIDTITGVANNNIKTAEYTIHIENGSNMQAQKVLVMQDGTTAYSQEYGIMHKSGLLVSMSATISGGNLLLQATPETGVSGTTTYKITRQTMR